jgi:hypothetical protein
MNWLEVCRRLIDSESGQRRAEGLGNRKMSNPNRDDIDRMSMKTLQREVRRLRALEQEQGDMQRLIDDSQIAGAGAGEMLRVARQQRDQYREEVQRKDAQLKAFVDLLIYHPPPTNTAMPFLEKLIETGAAQVQNWPFQTFHTETPPEETQKQLEAKMPNTVILQMGKDAIYVGLTISFFDGEHSGQLYNAVASFPGTKEQAYEALAPYSYAMLKLSPLPDDLAPRGVIRHYKTELGIPFENALLNAMLQISDVYWVDRVAERFYDTKVQSAFNDHILPTLPKNLESNEISDAQRDFNATVKATFQNVVRRRWPHRKNRKLKTGPKPKFE